MLFFEQDRITTTSTSTSSSTKPITIIATIVVVVVAGGRLRPHPCHRFRDRRRCQRCSHNSQLSGVEETLGGMEA